MALSLLLLRPWWLLAVPAAAALAWRRRGGARLGDWRRAVDPALLAALAARGQLVPGRGLAAAALPLALAVLTALALSGPARQRRPAATFRNLDGLVVAMDLSRSVAAGGRLPEARLATATIAAACAPRAVALVAYAGDAYVASGFSTDPAALAGIFAILDGDTVPDAGSRPERALALAHRLLEQARILHGDVLLVTDGGGIGPAALAEARALARAGHAVHTLFVPATDALPAEAPAPDPAALDGLATAGGGVAAGLDAPAPLRRRLAERPAARLARGDFAALAYRDLGRWLLVAALLPAALLFRRRA